MKKTKRLAIALLIVLLMQVFASCGSDDTAATVTTTTAESADVTEDSVDADEPDEPEKPGFQVSKVKEEIPDSNFNGRDFIIMTVNPEEKIWTYTNMVVEEETGDTIDDAYYKRNRLIEERLNINIKQYEIALANEQRAFRTEVESGAGSFDVALITYGAGANLATNNYCMAFNDMPYIDMDKPWWDKGSRRDLSIASRNYLMASDISIGDNDNTWLIYFDKQHVQDFGLETPYALVNEGKWTFDKMLEMMKAVEFDADSDGKMTMRSNDRFGFLTHAENYAGMWIAAGQTLITKNSQDMPEITFGGETFINAWHKIIEIMNDSSTNNNNIDFISEGLRDGLTLFGTEILKFVRNYREHEREFGIIPMPKFNETQQSHHTYVAVSAPLLVIPRNCPDIETTGIIVEAMAAEGHSTILPAYYETAIKGKFVRDEESIEMLSIAFDTRLYDLGVVFDWGSMKSQLNTAGNRNDGGIASILESRGAAMQAAIDKTFDAFEGY